MYILDTFFYFIHKFYSKVLSKYDDHVDTTILALSAFQSIIIIVLSDFLSAFFFSNYIYSKIKIAFFIFMLFPNIYYFYFKKNAIRIVKEKPKLFFNNEFLTIIIIFSTFIFCTTWFIWQAFYHDCLDAIFQIDRSKLI